MNILIPMAGLGSRFAKEGILTPKPLIKVNGKTLIEHSVESLGIEGRYIFVTREFEDKKYNVELSALLKKLKPDCLEICLKEQTNSPVETCLAVKPHINNDQPLIVTNSDQRTENYVKEFVEWAKNNDLDGAVVTHKSDNPKHSFALVRNGNLVKDIEKIIEKEVISNDALVGVHYWRNGYDFIESCESLLKSNNKQECFISETYNHLIKRGRSIFNYPIEANKHIFLGTPLDVSKFEAKIHEYETPKPKTIFCDLDGTIFKHCHKYSDLKTEPVLLDGVLDKFNKWDSLGHRILIVTARKESSRQITEGWLHYFGIPFDQLVMGISSGPRILINDRLSKDDPERAKSVNITTDSGFNTVKWEEFGL